METVPAPTPFNLPLGSPHSSAVGYITYETRFSVLSKFYFSVFGTTNIPKELHKMFIWVKLNKNNTSFRYYYATNFLLIKIIYEPFIYVILKKYLGCLNLGVPAIHILNHN